MYLPSLTALGVAFAGLCSAASSDNAVGVKLAQIKEAMKDTNGQIDTTDNGVEANTSDSLRAGPRGYNLLEDTSVRKKMLHFDRERQPERVVHALGSGAYGKFESYGDWSNMTMACWLQEGAVSEVFVRFSVVVASVGGSESERDTHGFATKIYSECGNQDLVGNHISSFFINDGAQFPDLIHAVKKEANKGFPTDGTAHRTAYDFFNLHPESALQLMYVLSDLGLPRDPMHMSGNSIHTYELINAERKATLFKWYWLPVLGHRAVTYDEATTIAGKNNNFQRVALYENIEAGIYPEWELGVQIFPDHDDYMWNGYDLLIPTQVVPFEVNPPIKLGKMTLNRNFNNWFAEPESISFAPSNVVDGVSWVPDPLLQWRLMSYDDTSTHRHGSPNGATLPINRPIAPVNNNYRDGYMQPYIYVGDQTSTPNDIGGVQEPSMNETLAYTQTGTMAGKGAIGRYNPIFLNPWRQAQNFWVTMDKYAQQHTVNGYVFELGNVGAPATVQRFIDDTLNNIDNCLARRVAWGVGAKLPAIGSGPMHLNATKYPSQYPLNPNSEPGKSNAGLQVAVVANNTLLTEGEAKDMMSELNAQKVSLAVVAPYVGQLKTGVMSTSSFIITSQYFYDAVFIGSFTNGGNSSSCGLDMNSMNFILGAYDNGKAIGLVGSSGMCIAQALGIAGEPGVYTGSASAVTKDVLNALSGPVRFPQRFPTDDIAMICGSEAASSMSSSSMMPSSTMASSMMASSMMSASMMAKSTMSTSTWTSSMSSSTMS